MKRDIFSLQKYMKSINFLEKDIYIRRLNNILKLINQPFTILVYGEINTGKSSFLNALLQEEVSPKDIKEKTGNCIFFEKGNQNECYAILKKNGRREKLSIKNKEEYNEAVLGKGKYKDAILISKAVNSIFLNDKVIIDSPGLNSLNKFSVVKSIDQTNQVDFVIFVFRAQQLGKASEEAELNKLKKMGRKIIAVINKADLSKNPLKQSEELRLKFNNVFEKIFCVKSEPINNSEGFTDIKKYFKSIDKEKLKRSSIIDLVISNIESIREIIKDELKTIKNNHLVNDDVFDINVPNRLENIENMRISATDKRIANVKITQIRNLLDQISINLRKQVNNYIDKKLNTLGSLRTFFDADFLNDIDKCIDVDEQLYRLEKYLDECDINDINLKQTIKKELIFLVNKSRETVNDNLKELFTEAAKEILLEIIPAKKMGKLKHILSFLHRTNISPIENKKMYVKALIDDRISKSFAKEKLYVQEKLIHKIYRSENGITFEPENTIKYIKELSRIIRKLNMYKERFKDYRRNAL